MNKFNIFKAGFMKKRIREAYLKSSSESIRTQYSHTHTSHDSVDVSKTGYEIFGIKNNDKMILLVNHDLNIFIIF